MNAASERTQGPASARSGPRAGQVIGERYRLEELLERGAMGSVWRAEQIRLRAPAAVKFLAPALIGDATMRERFMQEARSAAAVRSVNVVQIFDYGSDGDVPYIAMELLEGEDLGTRLAARGTLTPAELNKIFGEVARGIGQAHAMGVVHRDVKPGNIFIVREGEHEITKLIDFGIAKVKADALKFTQIVGTQLGTLLGTPQYMSPEQVRGSATLDHRTDLWALAIIACECLTGRYPFPGTSIGDLAVQICTEKPRAPSALGAVPPGFDQWFFKGTSKRPSQRFLSVEEMAAALDRILASVAATPASSWLLGAGQGLAVRRVWEATTRRMAPLPARARRTIGGWSERVAAFASGLRRAEWARAVAGHLDVRRFVSSRTDLIALGVLLLASIALALSWQARREAPVAEVQAEPPSGVQAVVQAAFPAPANAEPGATTGSPGDGASPRGAAADPSGAAADTAARAEPSRDVPLENADRSEAASPPARAPSERRANSRARAAVPDPDAVTPLGPMSIAMGEAGARIANGGDEPRARVRSTTGAAPAGPRPRVGKGGAVTPPAPVGEARRD